MNKDKSTAKLSQAPRAERNKYVRFRHRLVYTLLRPLFGIFVRFKYNYRADKYIPQAQSSPPYFILSSHTGALDPFFVAMSFKNPLYFVASDHLFRLGLISRIINYLVAPIPIVKSQIDLQAMRQILTVSKEGGSICLFPSGNRSYAGPELPIPEATGKLVKRMRMTTLLYRIDGGYLSSPRWARYPRKGQMKGQVARTLSLEEIDSLSVGQINEILTKTLETNPYINKSKAADGQFLGKFLAEYLERVLFVCPACHGLNTLKSRQDELNCGCGLSLRYLENGCFEGLNIKSAEIAARLPQTAAFDEYQRNYLTGLLNTDSARAKYTAQPLFTDEDEELFIISRAKSTRSHHGGRLACYIDRLELEGYHGKEIFKFDIISTMSIHGPQVLQFHDSSSDIVYEIKSAKPRSAYKYLLVFNIVRKLPDTGYSDQISRRSKRER